MFSKQLWKVFAVAMPLFSLPATSYAVDSISIECAVGNRTQIARIGAQWDWQRKWLQSNGKHVGGYWNFSASDWRQNRFQNVRGNTHYIYDISITPVLRLQRDDKAGLYAEAGIGAHFLSDTYSNNGRQLSDNFQFGSHVGAGYVFNNHFDMALLIQHISNGGFKKPNDGVNFGGVRISYRF